MRATLSHAPPPAPAWAPGASRKQPDPDRGLGDMPPVPDEYMAARGSDAGDAGPSFEPRGGVLVTGGAGFIASHVAERLARRYPRYNVVVLDSLDYSASSRNLEGVRHLPNFTFVEGDVRSRDVVRFVLQAHDVDCVLHFAAQTHVDASFGNSLAFSSANVLGTHCLLEECRVYGRVRRFINVSTDEVYGEQSYVRELARCVLARHTSPNRPHQPVSQPSDPRDFRPARSRARSSPPTRTRPLRPGPR